MRCILELYVQECMNYKQVLLGLSTEPALMIKEHKLKPLDYESVQLLKTNNISKSKTDTGHIFSNHALLMLIIPVIAEQFLTSLMGLADSMMVSNVDDYSLGAVQLVDSINILVNQAFAALATGGVVICSNFIGQKNKDKAQEAARQVSLSALILSVSITIICLLFRNGILTSSTA
jgi:Na+-driven multidrug efflux pump